MITPTGTTAVSQNRTAAAIVTTTTTAASAAAVLLAETLPAAGPKPRPQVRSHIMAEASSPGPKPHHGRRAEASSPPAGCSIALVHVVLCHQSADGLVVHFGAVKAIEGCFVPARSPVEERHVGVWRKVARNMGNANSQRVPIQRVDLQRVPLQSVGIC